MASKPTSETSTGAGNASTFERFRDYLTESRAEIKKVTWPTKKETRMTSIAVLVLVAVMAIFLGLVDAALTWLVNFILTLGIMS